MAKEYFEDLCSIYNTKISKSQEAPAVIEEAKKGSVATTLPADTFPAADKAVETGKAFNTSGPEAAEGFDVKVAAVNEADKKTDKKDKKAVKKKSSEISNYNMKENTNLPKKSIFDQLYEDVMSDEVAPETPAADIAGEVEDLADEPAPAPESDLAASIAEIIEKLQALQAQLAPADEAGEEAGEDIEDIEDAEEATEEMKESHADLKKAPDAITKLAGQNNKAGNVTPAGGKADASAGGSEDGGKAKPAADSVKALTGKNNKAGSITGGNKPLFKA